MSLLSKEALLAARQRPTETVPVPELGGDVVLRGLSGRERDAFEESLFVQKGKKRERNMANVRARLVALCAVDDQGSRLFTDADVELIGEMRADVVDRLFDVAQRLSGLREQDVDELGKPSA